MSTQIRERFCLPFCYFASKIVEISTFREKSHKNRRVVYWIKIRFRPKSTAFPFFLIPKDLKKTKKQRLWWVLFFSRFFQPSMSNLQKNHVKIDVFNEPKYRFDPNQVHSSTFHPHKTPKKQKNIIFGTLFFWSKCSGSSILGRLPAPASSTS